MRENNGHIRQRTIPRTESSRPAGYGGFRFTLQNTMPLTALPECYDRVSIPLGHRFGDAERTRILPMGLYQLDRPSFLLHLTLNDARRLHLSKFGVIA